MSARWKLALGLGALSASMGTIGSAQTRPSARALPVGYGTLTQNDLAIRLRTDDIEVRVVPLDERVLRLLAPDGYQTLRGLITRRQAALDSVSSMAGVSRPGVALVTFFALRPGARYDPQTLTLQVRSRVYQPLGVVALSPRFAGQQLAVREQASALYLFEEELPVNDSFTVSYGGLLSGDWLDKVPTLDRERGRISARARDPRWDSTQTR